jgi:hypothetical protein
MGIMERSRGAVKRLLFKVGIDATRVTAMTRLESQIQTLLKEHTIDTVLGLLAVSNG